MDSKRPPNCICPAAQCYCKKKPRSTLDSDVFYDTVDDPTDLTEVSSSLGRTAKTQNDNDPDNSNLTDKSNYDPRQEPVEEPYYDARNEENMKNTRSYNKNDNDNYNDKEQSNSPWDNFVMPDGSGLRVNVTSQGGLSVTASPKKSNQSATVKLSFGNQCPVLRGSYECFPKDGDDGGFECRPKSLTTYNCDANEMKSNADYEFISISKSSPPGLNNGLEEPVSSLKAPVLQVQTSLPSNVVFGEHTSNLRVLDQQLQTSQCLLYGEQPVSKLEVLDQQAEQTNQPELGDVDSILKSMDLFNSTEDFPTTQVSAVQSSKASGLNVPPQRSIETEIFPIPTMDETVVPYLNKDLPSTDVSAVQSSKASGLNVPPQRSIETEIFPIPTMDETVVPHRSKDLPSTEASAVHSSKTSRSNVTQRSMDMEAAQISAMEEKVVPLLNNILEVLQTMRDEKYHLGPITPINIEVSMDGIQIPEPPPSPKLTKELLGTSSHASQLSTKKRDSLLLIDLDPPVRDVETSAASNQRLIPVDMELLRNDEGIVWEPNMILDSKFSENSNLQSPIVPLKTADHQDIPEKEIQDILGESSDQGANASSIPLLKTPSYQNTPDKEIRDALKKQTDQGESVSPLWKAPSYQDTPDKEIRDALKEQTDQGESVSPLLKAPSHQGTPDKEIRDALKEQTDQEESVSPLLKVPSHQDTPGKEIRDALKEHTDQGESASPLLKAPSHQDTPDKQIRDALREHIDQGESASLLLKALSHQDTPDKELRDALKEHTDQGESASPLLKAPSQQDRPENEIRNASTENTDQRELASVPVLMIGSNQDIQQKQIGGENQKSKESLEAQSGDTNKGQEIRGGDKPGDITNRQNIGTDQQTALSNRSDRSPEEMSQFIESIRFDLESMQYVRKSKCGILCCQKKSPPPLPCPSVPPGGWHKPLEDLSFPATIQMVKPFGDSSLFVKWEVQNTNNIAGFEIFLDGYLTNRYFSYIHRAAVICNVNLTCAHRIVLRAKSLTACNAVATTSQMTLPTSARNTNPEASVKQADGSIWSPSTFYFEPNNPPSPTKTKSLVRY